MPILVDFNQTCIAAIYAQMGPKEVESFSEEHVPLLRYMVFNMLRSYRQKYRGEFGELIICTDNKSWRKQAFPLYKAHRATDRAATNINWELIFKTLYSIQDDLRENFPYKVMNVPGAEADDIIAVLCEYYATNELGAASVFDNEGDAQAVLILSADKDFGQLQRFSNVKQFSPTLKKWVKHKDWRYQLRELVIRGDSGDGIPNFKSPDNAIVDKIRQTPIYEKDMEMYLAQPPEKFCTAEELVRFKRNEQLIDFRFIPAQVKADIMGSFIAPIQSTRRNILSYFIKNKMRNMIELVGDF